jgi:hypothetical protein
MVIDGRHGQIPRGGPSDHGPSGRNPTGADGRTDNEVIVMNTKALLASAAFSAALLASGLGYAADGIGTQIEATRAAMLNYNPSTVDRSDREAATVNLDAAAAAHRNGNDARAQSFLNFARGELGLPVNSALVASPVVASPAPATAASFDRQLGEAKAASADARREIRDTVAVSLSTAEGLEAQGKLAQAQSYLNFARGELGLDVPAPSNVADSGITGLRPEAR